MYCNKCGTRLNGNESFCTGCGNKINDDININYNVNMNNNVDNSNNVVHEEKDGKKTASIVLGILSLVGSLLFIFAPIALILSIIGLILGIIANKKVSNTAGIVLNSIGVLLSLVMSVVLFFVFMYAVVGISGTIEDLWDVDEDSYYNSDYDYYNDDVLSDF